MDFPCVCHINLLGRQEFPCRKAASELSSASPQLRDKVICTLIAHLRKCGREMKVYKHILTFFKVYQSCKFHTDSTIVNNFPMCFRKTSRFSDGSVFVGLTLKGMEDTVLK